MIHQSASSKFSGSVFPAAATNSAGPSETTGHLRSFSNTYFDFAEAGDAAALKAASDNVRSTFPDYSFERRKVTDALSFSPMRGTQSFLVLQEGLAQLQFLTGERHQASALLRPGDLIMLTSDDRVLIEARSEATLFSVSIQSDSALLPERRGITKLELLPNILGGCNPGGVPPDSSRDFRRVVHVQRERNADQTFPQLDIYAVQLLKDRSRPHYHPQESIGGPSNQHELYLFLQPESLRLQVPNERFLTTWAPGAQKHEGITIEVRAGDLASIPAGVGHHAQGMAMIFAFPGTVGLPNAVGIGKLPGAGSPPSAPQHSA